MSEQYNLNSRYQLMGLIGKGRLGDVYRAADNFFRKEVALKMLRKESATPEFTQYFTQRYAQQIAAMGNLNNPAIIKTYDFTRMNNVPAWTMDLLPGTGLSQYSGQQMPLEQAASLLTPVADALSYAHQYGIVHGNLKPSNILFSSSRTPVQTDFGLAQWLSENGRGYGAFEANAGIGSPEYLSPEQARGQAADPRSDVYSLGIILYELITGRVPFTSGSPMDTMARQVNEPLPSPRYFVPNISQQAEQFLYQATQKNPAQRLSSMSEFAMMLRNLSTPSASGAFYPPASYYNNNMPTEDDDDDDDDESFGDKIKALWARFKANKNAKIVAIAILGLCVLGIIISIINGNQRQLQADNATATQSAIYVEETQQAVQEMIEGQARATQEAINAEQTAQAEAANLAATEAAIAALPPTPEPIQIPVTDVMPTAVTNASGRFQSQSPADGTNFVMGEAFNVTWNMENTGGSNWAYNYKLVYAGGVNFTADNITEQNIGVEVWPGGAAPLTLACVAPNTPGNFTMYWNLVDANGTVFYENLSVTINAVEGYLTPTPAPTSEILPTETLAFYISE